MQIRVTGERLCKDHHYRTLRFTKIIGLWYKQLGVRIGNYYLQFSKYN